MGRPIDLTEETKNRLINAIRSGSYYDAACGYAGISYQTFRNWIKRGEKGEEPFFEFLEELKRAEHHGELQAVLEWRRHFSQDWRACATFLERRHPAKWAKFERHHVTGDVQSISQTLIIIGGTEEEYIDKWKQVHGSTRGPGPGHRALPPNRQ